MLKITTMVTIDKKQSTSSFPKHSESPFHDGNKESLKLKAFPIQPRGALVNIETGEISSKNAYVNRRLAYMDTAKSMKLFTDSFQVLLTLSNPGMRVFFYVAFNLQKGSDRVYIAPQSVKDFTGYAANKDVYKGIMELIEKKVIAKSQDLLIYFVNPNVMFMGNKAELLK